MGLNRAGPQGITGPASAEPSHPRNPVGPTKWCFCAKRGCDSLILHADAGAVIYGFKQTCCVGCPDREPKQGTS
jgi:hypothetical protein